MPQDEFDLVRKVAEETGLAKPIADAQASVRLTLAEGKLAAAEAKLSALRSVLLEGGQDDASIRHRAIAIIGTEEDSHG